MKSRFAERDRDHDGVLQVEELSDSLRSEVEKWDKNQNGVIEWEEYKEYSMARSRYFQDQRDSNGGYGSDNHGNHEGGEAPRLVYRAGYLPRDLPNWFSQTKHADPTQISLSEWLTANQNSQKGTVSIIDDFRKFDRNLDGFITIEEALAAEKARTGRSTPLGGAISSNGQPPPREEPMLVIAPVPETPEGALTGRMTTPGASYGNGSRGSFGKGGPTMPSGGDPRSMFGKGGPTMPSGGDPRSMFGKGGPTIPTGGDPRGVFGRGGPTIPTGGDPRRSSSDNKSSSNDPKKSEPGRPSGNDSKGRSR
jgi:Ca2+-binding EF-hand superfamily protein